MQILHNLTQRQVMNYTIFDLDHDLCENFGFARRVLRASIARKSANQKSKASSKQEQAPKQGVFQPIRSSRTDRHAVYFIPPGPLLQL